MIDANLGIKRWEKEGKNWKWTRDRSRGKSREEAFRTPGYHRDFPREGRGGGAFVARFAVLNGVKSIKV